MSASRSDVVSSFTIIKGAMIDETYAIFQDWDFDRSREENLRTVRDENTIGATSANWLRDVYKVLHRRFEPNGRDRALVQLAKVPMPLDEWKPILLWHITREERLLRDFLTNWLHNEYQSGTYRLRSENLLPYLQRLPGIGWVEKPWKETTTKRVATALLRLAADFGLMTTTTPREFASYYLPERSFLYLLHRLYEIHGNGHDVVHSPEWRLFMMDSSAVERELFRLHQFRKLRFEVAGSLMDLSLPHASAAAFVEEIVS